MTRNLETETTRIQVPNSILLLGVILFCAAIVMDIIGPPGCISLDRPYVTPLCIFAWIGLTCGGLLRTFVVRDRIGIVTFVIWLVSTALLVSVLGGARPVPCKSQNGQTLCGRDANKDHWYYKECPTAP